LLQVFRTFGDAVPDGLGGCGDGLFRRCEEGVEIELARVHGEITGRGAGPCCAGAVPIEFDAILVGIAEIEGLTYAVVGGSVERDFVSDESFKRLG
jgi:hypothetical protein